MHTRILASVTAALALTLPSIGIAQHTGNDQHEHATTANPTKAHGRVKGNVRTIEMAVTSDGFVPAEVKVKKGEKVRLVVTRKVEKTCATEIVVKDYGISQPLPLNKAVTVELTPTKTGTVRYACGMDMIAGALVVE